MANPIQQRCAATRSLLLGLTGILVIGCGGEPPERLGGFEVGANQQEVVEAARARDGFQCRLRGTSPSEALCEGPAEEGVVSVLVRGDSLIRVRLRLDPAEDEEPEAFMRRFVSPFGKPAWRDRPPAPGSPPPDRYHTLWLDEDSVRGLTLLCAGPELEPPCTAELAETSPMDVNAKLDSLLGILR